MPRIEPRNGSTTATPVLHPSNPTDFVRQSLGLHPDPVQSALLDSNPHRLILNCCRQWGKSTITAAKAVHQSWFQPESLILVVSPSLRQSSEFIRKAATYTRKLGIKPRGDGDNSISLLLPNGSRIVGLPGQDSTIRGFSAVSLLLVDEASRVSDDLYLSVRPMLAASNGALWLISTPNGRRGFFYESWTQTTGEQWTRISIPATECPRISPAFLENERRAMPARFFEQEYLCQFQDAEDAVFTLDVIARAWADIPHVFTTAPNPAASYYIGVDLGQRQDYTAIAILERATVITGPRDPVTYEYPRATTYSIRHLERLPLGTPYPDVIAHIAAITRHPTIAHSRQLIIDATGVGQPVVDLLRRAHLTCRLVPVSLTAGDRASQRHGHWYVPRRELLAKLEIGLQQGHLKISNRLAAATQLGGELQNLRLEKTTGHDDLVFAVALANWRATLFPAPVP